MLAKWHELRDRNPEQPLDELMVMDALIRGSVDRAKTRVRKRDGMVRVDFELPAEVIAWLEEEALRQGVAVIEVVHRLIAADRAWRATRA